MMSIQSTDNCVYLKKSVKVLVAQLCLTLCDRMDCSPQAPHPWDSLGKNTGVGCHFLLQGIFRPQDQTQVSCTAGKFFTEPPGKPPKKSVGDFPGGPSG